MPLYSDQTGRKVDVPITPNRIVSLVPSQTELLFDLGLDNRVAGITKFCIHPNSWFRSKTRVGGTKDVHIERLQELKPDLILANREENVREQVEEMALHFPVWVSDVNTLSGAIDMIREVGVITGTSGTAAQIIDDIETELKALQPPGILIRAAYLIWRAPYMAAGNGTFINDMLQRAGFTNHFSDLDRYPEVNWEMLRGADIILLSSEPYPFAEKHIQEIRSVLGAVPVLLVDGELFSWYGSRLRKSAAYFRKVYAQALFLTHAGS